MFYSNFMQTTMTGADHILIDCTFKPVPEPFEQLLFVPVVYTLLRDKKEPTYMQAFTWMKQAGANPKYATSDFEVRTFIHAILY